MIILFNQILNENPNYSQNNKEDNELKNKNLLSIFHPFSEHKKEQNKIYGNEPGISIAVFKRHFSKNIENKNSLILSNIFWAFDLDFQNQNQLINFDNFMVLYNLIINQRIHEHQLLNFISKYFTCEHKKEACDKLELIKRLDDIQQGQKVEKSKYRKGEESIWRVESGERVAFLLTLLAGAGVCQANHQALCPQAFINLNLTHLHFLLEFILTAL